MPNLISSVNTSFAMEYPHILRDSAIRCRDAFRQCLSVPSLNDQSWVENRLGDFNLWLTNLRVLKPGHASLDYRLRDREDLRNVVESLLRSLHEFVERCCVPEQPTSNQSFYEAQGSDGSVSSWSDISDEENGPLKKKQVPASVLSDPISGVESTLDRLIRLGMVIRQSGGRFRHELADRSLDVSNHEELKRHLEFVLLNEQVSGQEYEDDVSQQDSEKLSGNAVPFVTREKLLAQVKLSDFQQRAIHANIIRRNRFDFAKNRELKANPRRQPKLIEQQPPNQKPTAPIPAPTPMSNPQFKDPDAESRVSLSRPSIVETATQVGTVTTPVEPTPSKAATRTTQMSTTGKKLDYPACPQLDNPDDASFQCPFCYQQLPKKYLENSAWRSHVHGDIIPYICIFENCPNQESFFASKEDWTQHLRAAHSKKYWQCPFPDICENKFESRFANESDWIGHMATHQSANNQSKFSTTQLQIVAGTNIIHDFSIESCPLCYFSSPINEEETIKHIAEHLHSFALRSLPWDNDFDEDQSAVTQAMDVNARSDLSGDSGGSFEIGNQSHATPENPYQFRQVIADWQANIFNTKIPPSYKVKLEQVCNAAAGLYLLERRETSPTYWDSIRKVETDLLGISWIIEQLEEVITPSGDLRCESMSERREDLDKDFKDLVSALILPEAKASQEKPLDRADVIEKTIQEKRMRQKDITTDTSLNASRADLRELAAKLELPSKMKEEIELNLLDSGREIIFRGDLKRTNTATRFLVDTHAILFDHYFVLAKGSLVNDQSHSASTATSQQSPPLRPQDKRSNAEPRTAFSENDKLQKAAPFKHADISGIDSLEMFHTTLPFDSRAKQRTTKDDIRPYDKYIVSKFPIPMDLLVLESIDDDPVVKSAMRNAPTMTPQGNVTPITHTEIGASTTSGAAVSENEGEGILFPFTIKHLGKAGTYTLYSSSAQVRMDWCQKVIEAKTKRAATLLSQNAEPFQLRVLADTAFSYSDQVYTSAPQSITFEGTPLHRAIKEAEEKYDMFGSRPAPVCETSVNCATTFQQPRERQMCAIGTNSGVFISDLSKTGSWYRAIPMVQVTQVAVLEEFNLFLLISDQSLFAYHLETVCPANGAASQFPSSARPLKLSGDREVGFFATGLMKNRYLVFCKMREGLGSTFKVLEPLRNSKSNLFQSHSSQSKWIREYEEFYIPTEAYSIDLFHSAFALSTERGIEALTLDKKQPWSIPDFRLEPPDVSNTLMRIADRIKNLRALGMFRLSDSEFLVAYQECAVYVNNQGDVSRSVVIEFLGSAYTACQYKAFLVLFNDDFVEVRNAIDGRLRQVIPGHNVVCLDTGSKQPSLFDPINSTQHTVKIRMQHPDSVQSQLVLELVENPDFIC